ncbi:hypothetical protein XELAEV_18040360mg [Xenopus laevis]|uniref:Uncharacterized protein n=1 Tax=Xenopus laevis TaxID=8355 RepID=A0A974C9K7_XENLA|nr:hypothetical protein XELAEV_18040360mg [Xenopus laevis]
MHHHVLQDVSLNWRTVLGSRNEPPCSPRHLFELGGMLKNIKATPRSPKLSLSWGWLCVALSVGRAQLCLSTTVPPAEESLTA